MRDSNLVISLGRWFVIASITIHVFLVIVWFQGILIMRGLEEIESHQVPNRSDLDDTNEARPKVVRPEAGTRPRVPGMQV